MSKFPLLLVGKSVRIIETGPERFFASAGVVFSGDRGVRSQTSGLLWYRPVLRGAEAARSGPVWLARPPGECDGE